MVPLGDYRSYLNPIIETNKRPFGVNDCYIYYNYENNQNPYIFAIPNPVNFISFWIPDIDTVFRRGFMDPNERKIYSQDGTDGVLEYIFNSIGTTNKKYVELGTEDGKECNTRFLREHRNWNGIMVDGGYENHEIGLKKHFITLDNILDILEKYNTDTKIDLLSIDLDGNDFYILRKILSKYSPRVIVAEYNGFWEPNEDKVIPYDENFTWDHKTNYSGMSLLAATRLLSKFDYSLVYTTSFGVNSFFIKNTEIKEEYFCNINDIEFHYKRPKYGTCPHKGHQPDDKNRPWRTSESILKYS